MTPLPLTANLGMGVAASGIGGFALYASFGRQRGGTTEEKEFKREVEGMKSGTAVEPTLASPWDSIPSAEQRLNASEYRDLGEGYVIVTKEITSKGKIMVKDLVPMGEKIIGVRVAKKEGN